MSARPSYILGLNCYTHDSSVALLRDGEIVGTAEEERFTGEKHTGAFPSHALRWVLNRAGIELNDLSHVAFYMDPLGGLLPRLLHGLRNRTVVHRSLAEQLALWKQFTGVSRHFPPAVRKNYWAVNHYQAHAAAAFAISPFAEAAIAVVDGNGEYATTWLGTGGTRGLRCVQEIYFPHSLGLMYAAITEYLGYQFNSDECRVMSLAALGTPRLLPAFRRCVRMLGPGRFALDTSFFSFHDPRFRWMSKRFADEFGPPRQPGKAIEAHHLDIAYAVQACTEDIVLRLVAFLLRSTGHTKLCFSGGVALNCVAGAKLLREFGTNSIFVPPFPGDSGTSLGAAMWLAHYKLNIPRKALSFFPPGQGPAFSEQDYTRAAQAAGLTIRRPIDLPGDIAALLEHGKIIGYMDGAMEAGPRALGNRSILADPRDARMKNRLNKIKRRENYRPFGGSVLDEYADTYFPGLPKHAPYMAFAVEAAEHARGIFPAILHVDGTSRVQRVVASQSSRFYALISAFGQRTGCYCLLNTSLNSNGFPIARTPKDAIACMRQMGLDYLVLGNLLCEETRETRR